MFEQLLRGVVLILDPLNFMAFFTGFVAGVIIGALPGLTSPMGVALLIPFTYAMDPIPALAMLTALYCGGTFGGSISAILVRAPGTPAAAATTFDGYPLAQKGQAGKALGTACISSSIGGLFSILVLILLAPQLAAFALRFGPAEYFALSLFGLSMLSSISAHSTLKNLIGGLTGVLLAMVGIEEISGFSRFDFGLPELMHGISFVPVMIGLFAGSEVFRQVARTGRAQLLTRNVSITLPSWAEIKQMRGTMLRSSLIGTYIGILPAEGGTIASFIGYNEAKRFSKHPEKFGTGILEGVAAPETANNAATGGAMVPTLALGIPGSGTTAVILGAMMIQGLRPGPLLFIQHADLVYAIFVAMFLANLIFLVVGLGGAKIFAQVVRVPTYLLTPIIMVLCVVGSYALNNNIADVWIMIACAVVGFYMGRHGFSAAPIVLGLVLGPLIEVNFRRALIIFSNDVTPFLTRPYSALFLFLTVLGLSWPYLRQAWADRFARKKERPGMTGAAIEE